MPKILALLTSPDFPPLLLASAFWQTGRETHGSPLIVSVDTRRLNSSPSSAHFCRFGYATTEFQPPLHKVFFCRSADIRDFSPALFTKWRKQGEKVCFPIILVESAKKWGKQGGGERRKGDCPEYPLIPEYMTICVVFQLHSVHFCSFSHRLKI